MEEGFSTVGLISLGLNPLRQVGRLVHSMSVGSPYWRFLLHPKIICLLALHSDNSA